jgi:hypothetical protein
VHSRITDADSSLCCCLLFTAAGLTAIQDTSGCTYHTC